MAKKTIVQVTGLAVLLVVLAWAGITSGFFEFLKGQRPLATRELATRVLAEHLASAFPGKTPLILSNPFSTLPGQPDQVYDFEKAGIAGLREGAKSRMKFEEVAFPELKPGAKENPQKFLANTDTTTPLSYLVTDEAFDRVFEKHSRADLLVSLVGLPANIRKTRLWAQAPPPQFALLLPDLRMLGSEAAIVDAFRTRRIVAAVLAKPGAPPEDQRMGKDLRMEFDIRYLLITPENLDHYRQAFPRLF